MGWYGADVPRYRLIFPPVPGTGFEQEVTAEIESEVLYKVGDVITWEGRRWQVSQAPLEDPRFDQVADLMVWPADG